MKCKDTSRLITDKLAGELSPAQYAKLRKHLDECETCRKEYEQSSKLWLLIGETLKQDSFAEELTPARKCEIFGVAAKRSFFSFHVSRIVEYAAVACVVLILIGMMLPALNQARGKARRISAASERKQAELEKMMADMDAAEAADREAFEESPKYAGIKEDHFARRQVAGKDGQLFAPAPVRAKIKAKKSMKPGSREVLGYSSIDNGSLPVTAAPKKEIKRLGEEIQLSEPASVPKETRAKTYNVPLLVENEELKSANGSNKKEYLAQVFYDQELKKPEQIKKTFNLDLKLWNLTKNKSVKKFLTDHNCSTAVGIWIYRSENKIIISGSEANMKKVEKLFEKLKAEEQELKDLRKGLPFIKTSSRPISTFSIDTDTASYVQARKSIMRGMRPDPLKIRPEEFINYFDYNYHSPENATFAVYPEAAPSPFRPDNTLLRIGIQGKRLGPNADTRSNYIILLDTSGSMAVKDRMELAKKALKMLFSRLKDNDVVSLMLCGEKAVLVAKLRPLSQANRQWLLTTLDKITPYGTADFAEGISKAYTFADRYYRSNCSNRVIIISDGIFELTDANRPVVTGQIESARKRGISNIVIGLGGDGDDAMLEKVASTGDGSYVFLDTESEARELFSSQFEARFREIARDVKIQVQFNKDAVKSYRQIGYKNRQLSAADFRDDKVDAGEVGSGQAVTALYELKLEDNIAKDTIIATIRIRCKKVEDMGIEEKVFYLYGNDIKEKFSQAGANFKLAALVAEFAESLRYPETQGIASTRGIADKLNALKMKDFSKSTKVNELLALIRKSK